MINISSITALLAFSTVVASYHNASSTNDKLPWNESTTATTGHPNLVATTTPSKGNDSTTAAPSSRSDVTREPKAVSFASISTDEQHSIKTLSAINSHGVSQTEGALRRAYVKQLWVDVLRQASPYMQNGKWATMKAETLVRKSFAAKYILRRLSGFATKPVMPVDDGLFEGDVLLPDFVTDRIIGTGLSLLSDLRSDAELESVLQPSDIDLLAKVTSKQQSAADVLWWSKVFYSIDKTIHEGAAADVRKAIAELANATTRCLSFVASSSVSEHTLNDTVVIRKMPNWSRVKLPTCVIASLGRRPVNFLYVNFSCPNIKGEVLHGLMHVLGVVHGHNRIDRADHIDIQWSKMAPDYIDYFIPDRLQLVSTFDTPFDFNSITMYPPTVGAADSGAASFVAKNVSAVSPSAIGQRERLSFADANLLRRMYCEEGGWDMDGVIASSAIGGVVLVILLGLLFYACLKHGAPAFQKLQNFRNRRRRHRAPGAKSEEQQASHIQAPQTLRADSESPDGVGASLLVTAEVHNAAPAASSSSPTLPAAINLEMVNLDGSPYASAAQS